MKWAHLPVAGGIYDQDPRFIEAITLIMARRAEYQREKDERDARERERKNKAPRTAGHRRR